MTFPFDTSEQLIFEFEQLLKRNGLVVQANTDLERISFAILENNAKHKKEIVHNDQTDIRDIFSDVAGLIDFVSQIVKHQSHKDFSKLVPHLQLLNTSSTSVLTTKSKVTDEGNNKLFELYIALLCMGFSENVDLDDPKNSKGDNPDIIFDYKGEKWAIACKAMHSDKEKTLYDTIVKGTDQINRSIATKGIVAVNLKNIIDRNEIWPITNQEDVVKGDDPLFGCFSTIEAPLNILQKYGANFQEKLIEAIGVDSLKKLADTKKCPAGFLIFLQAVTSVMHQGNCPATILKTFNLVELDNVDTCFKELGNDLNLSMHNRRQGKNRS